MKKCQIPNSSIDRIKSEGHDLQHGYPQSRQPIAEEGHYTYGNGGAPGYNPGYMTGTSTPGSYAVGAPQVPPKAGPLTPQVPRQVIKLDQSAGGQQMAGQMGGPVGGRPSIDDQPKRKSWLRRTLSRS